MLSLQDYCALQELLMKMNFTLAVAPPFVHPMTSLLVMPTRSVWKYGFLSEPPSIEGQTRLKEKRKEKKKKLHSW